MPMRLKTNFLFILTFFFIAANSYADEAATFVDLGFSKDSSKFMFAQYGVDGVAKTPWAEVFVVDVAKNIFVRDGVRRSSFEKPTGPIQEGEGAMRKLLAENPQLVSKNGIDLLNQGIPLFIDFDGIEDSAKTSFRDFDSGDSFDTELVSYVEGPDKDGRVRSSFFLNLTRKKKDGATVSYIVGTPKLKREGVSAYHIRRVLAAPQGRNLVFVVEMTKPNQGKGNSLRYMVETVKLE